MKLKRLALDFRIVAEMPSTDPGLRAHLEKSAAELEAIADGPCTHDQDVIWDESQDAETDAALTAGTLRTDAL